MGKSTPAAPTPIDPVATANAQGAANKDTAIAQARLNAVNSNGPFGSVSYTETPNASDPSVPNFTQTTSLSPAQQQLYDTQTGIEQQAYNTGAQALSNVQGTLSSPFSLSGLPSQPLTAADFATQGKQTTDALMQRFNQDWGDQQDSTYARLNAQGAQEGSKQYDTANKQLDRARNDAMAQALLGGNQEQNTLFQQGGQARQQAISEQQLVRSQPINEIATLLGLGGGIQTPSGAPNFGANIGQTDVLGAYGLNQQGQQNAYNQQIASNNATTGAIGSGVGAIGAAAIMF